MSVTSIGVGDKLYLRYFEGALHAGAKIAVIKARLHDRRPLQSWGGIFPAIRGHSCFVDIF